MTHNKFQNVVTPRQHLSSHYCFMLSIMGQNILHK